MNEIITLRETDNGRGYNYRAFIRRKTGSLICIKAGCRYWKTFDDAFRHYSANRKRMFIGTWPRWSDGWILDHNPVIQVQRRLMERHEAVKALTRLQTRVEDRRRQLRRERKR